MKHIPSVNSLSTKEVEGILASSNNDGSKRLIMRTLIHEDLILTSFKVFTGNKSRKLIYSGNSIHDAIDAYNKAVVEDESTETITDFIKGEMQSLSNEVVM